MLIVVVGKEREKVQSKIKSLYRADVYPEVFESESLQVNSLIPLVHATSLFGEVYTYIIRDCDENEEVEKYIYQNTASLQQSPQKSAMKF